MPAYVPDKLHEFGHTPHKRPQHCPYMPQEPRFGKAAQEPAPADTAPPLDPKGKTRIQQIVGSFLYYGRAVDITILKALNSLARQQSKPTKTTAKRTDQLLNYLATHPRAVIRYYASDMILQVHSDASYFNEPDGRSTARPIIPTSDPITHTKSTLPVSLNVHSSLVPCEGVLILPGLGSPACLHVDTYDMPRALT